jgi:hypothetical protein
MTPIGEQLGHLLRGWHGSIHRNSTASDCATHFIASLKG